MGRKVSDEEILEALRDVSTRVPSPMTTVAYRANQREGQPSAATAGTRFGGWGNALEAAGLPAFHRPWRKWTRTEALRAVAEWLATAPDTRSDAYLVAMRSDRNLPRPWHLVRLFGGWKQAVAAARALSAE